MALTKVSNNMLVQPVNHNILINPSFTVKQRGDVRNHVNDNSAYGPDRWKFRVLTYVGGTKVESSTEVDDATGINKLVVKHEGTTASFADVLQNIEAVNLQGLYGKEITLSFGYSDTGGSGIPTVRVGSFDSSSVLKVLYDAAPTSLGDNRWACTVTLSTNDGTIPYSTSNGMQVVIFANEGNNAPSEWRVWETKLEVGSVVTPFIARSYGEELSLCQRYFHTSSSGADLLLGGNTDLTRASFLHTYPCKMRSLPSISVESWYNWVTYDFSSFTSKTSDRIDFERITDQKCLATTTWTGDIGVVGGGTSLIGNNDDVFYADAEI